MRVLVSCPQDHSLAVVGFRAGNQRAADSGSLV